MEKQYEKPAYLKLKKRDGIFLAVVLVVAVAGLLWFCLGYSRPGSLVEATVDGEVLGAYPLAEARELALPGEEAITNRLVIAQGEAWMQWADCPDQICVEHRPISREGEEIVCLPNRIVVRVTGGDGPKTDAVAR